MANKHVEYSNAYVYKCRAIWYENECLAPRVAIDRNLFPPDELGRVVELGTLRHWLTDKDWYQWKDEQDAKLANQIDDELIARKMMIIKEQLAETRELRKESFLHLKENGFDSSAAAASSFFKASEQERTLIGVENIIEKLSKMQTGDIKARMRELAERVESDVIDVAEVPDNLESAEPLD